MTPRARGGWGGAEGASGQFPGIVRIAWRGRVLASGFVPGATMRYNQKTPRALGFVFDGIGRDGSLISGLSEPLGALLAYVGLRLLVGQEGGLLPPQVMGVLFGAVAGIMVYISLDELLPTGGPTGGGTTAFWAFWPGWP